MRVKDCPHRVRSQLRLLPASTSNPFVVQLRPTTDLPLQIILVAIISYILGHYMATQMS